MLIRSITGLFFVIVLVAVILFSFWSLIVFFGIVTLFASYEFYKLRQQTSLSFPVLLFTSAVTYIAIVLQAPFIELPNYIDFNYLFLPLILVVPIICDLFSKTDVSFTNTANSIFAALYIALPFGLLSHFILRIGNTITYDGFPVLLFFILLWSNDTFAYLTGKFFGKHKLWERISPKKTWEGFIGGMLFSCLAMYLILLWKDYSFNIESLIYPIIISCFGTLGDLSESLLKRQANVKDSGTLLPGHGGVLDRFDGVLLAVPVLFFVLEALKLVL